MKILWHLNRTKPEENYPYSLRIPYNIYGEELIHFTRGYGIRFNGRILEDNLTKEAAKEKIKKLNEQAFKESSYAAYI